MTLLGLDRMRRGAVEEGEVDHRLRPRVRTDSDSETEAGQVTDFGFRSAAGKAKVTAHDHTRDTETRALEMQHVSTVGAKERVRLLETGVDGVDLGTKAPERLHAGMEMEMGLGRMRGTAKAARERLLLAGTASAGLETQRGGTAVAVEVRARPLCGTVAEAAVQETQLVAGSDTVTERVVQEKALEHTIHVWMAVLVRWSESTATATGPCRMPGIAAKEAPATQLEAGTAAAVVLERQLEEVLERPLWAAAGRNAYPSSVARAAARATQLWRHVSDMLAQAGGSLCGHASRVC